MYFVLIMEKVQTGQVIEFYSNSCLVKTNFGKFKCLAIKNVVVGDFVDLEIIQDSKKLVGKILKINNRFSSLSKGYDDKEKLFAANITHVGILVTPKPKTSTEFIDKWILKTKLSNIKAFIVNNKIDLSSDKEYEEKIKIYENINIKVIEISAKYQKSFEELSDYIKGMCVLFVGNSGAGKSTLTSKIIDKDLKTNELSNDQGVHTTSISSLYELPSNRKIWTIVGKEKEHWLEPEMQFCSCSGFYFGMIKSNKPCYHIDSVKIASQIDLNPLAPSFRRMAFSTI